MEKTASLRPVLLDRDAHPAPTCPDSRRARAGEPARLRVLRSHFCMGSFCLEARDGPPPGVGTADLGDTEQGGASRQSLERQRWGVCLEVAGHPPKQSSSGETFIGRPADMPPLLIFSLACSLPGLGGPWPVQDLGP